MTERRVDIRLSVEDAEAKRALVEDKALLDSVSKGRTAKVALDPTAMAALERLRLKLSALSEIAANMRVGIDGKDALLEMDRIQLGLTKLGKTTAKPSIKPEGIASAIGQVFLLQRALDRLSGTTVSFDEAGFRRSLDEALRTEIRGQSALSAAIGATGRARELRQEINKFMFEGSGGGNVSDLNSRSFQNIFRSIHPFRGSGESGHNFLNFLGSLVGRGMSGTGGGFLGNIGSYFGNIGGSFGELLKGMPIGGSLPLGAGGAGVGLLIAQQAAGIISGLAASLGTTALGGGIGALGVLGARSLDPSAFSAITKQLQQEFLGSLTQGHNAVAPGTTAKEASLSTVGGAPSFLQGVLNILKQIGHFLPSIAPLLSGLFRASLPFLQMFVKVGEQAAKIMLPALTQALKAMAPALPIMAQGFVAIIKGFAGFFKAIGPQGMRDAAEIFLVVAKIIGGAIEGIGKVMNFLIVLTVDEWHAFRVAWDTIRHDTAVAFDDVRHALAAFGNYFAARFVQLWKDVVNIWNSIWDNVIGRTIRGGQDVGTAVRNMGHEVANLFDGARHEVSHLWDLLWSTLASNAKNDAQTIIGDVKNLATGIWNALRHLPGILWKLGREALQELWNGAKSIAHSVVGFFQGIGHDILHVFDVVTGRHSPSREMFLRGRDLMLGLEMGLKSRIGSVRQYSGHVGGSVVSWITAAMRSAHAPASWLPALERLVSLESGGNPRAVNPTAIAGGQHATGLWQMLPSTYASYAWGLPPGDLFNPIVEGIAALRYIMSNYGSPFNIPGLMSGNYHGYWGGGWIHEPVLGIGTHSGSMYGIAEHGPEYVSHGGGGNTYIFALDESYSDEQALRLIQKIRRYKQHHGRLTLGIA